MVLSKLNIAAFMKECLKNLKIIWLLLCLATFNSSFSQKSKSKKQASSYARFISIIDTSQATKDGMYLNGYVVNISWEQARKLNGKKVRVSGKVSIEKAYRQKKELYIRQGRERDTKHIDNPKIVVLSD